MHYYLWWAPQGSPPTKDLQLASNDIVVRAVRHHDDHSPLRAGVLREYMPLRQPELDSDDWIARPWTEQQLEFIQSDEPVRLVVGRPGAGKTTVLWKAIDARSNQRVLYLTWSAELAKRAEQYFQAYAPTSVTVRALDFTTFLGSLCEKQFKRITLSDSRQRFVETVEQRRLGAQDLGPWRDRSDALFAEVRAFLLGSAVPGNDNVINISETVRLSDPAYLERRGTSDGIGDAAARAALRVFSAFEKPGLWTRYVARQRLVGDVFPELIAADEALDRLRDSRIPSAYADFDRIVVDEAQDLTLRETAVVVELCRRIASQRGVAPWLLVAGDDGQTVRPSGFDWDDVSNLLTARFISPRQFHLEENLRSPDRVAGVIDRASQRYVTLDKRRRPTKQRRILGGPDIEAHLFYAEADKPRSAIDLLESVEDLMIVSPEERAPSWLPETLADRVFTPAEAKGLEFQLVCIVDPGKTLLQLDRAAVDRSVSELAEQARRTKMDQLRVALSRATETLVLLDVEPTEAERAASLDLLNRADHVDPEDLIEFFAGIDGPLDERILIRIADARNLVDERPRRAWSRAQQAVRLLHTDGATTMADDALRWDAYTTLVATAARLLVDGPPSGVAPTQVIDVAKTALDAYGQPRQSEAFEHLIRWCDSRSTPPFELLDAAAALGREGDWLKNALRTATPTLTKAIGDGATESATASKFTNQVERWLEAAGFVGDVTAEARRLRTRSIDTLLAARRLADAEAVLACIDPEDPARTGRLREAQGRRREAAEAFERADEKHDALRNWRALGQWGPAARLAFGTEQRDLDWLVELEVVMHRRPAHHADRLTPAEKQRLSELVASTQ
jgi:hypothetical protein